MKTTQPLIALVLGLATLHAEQGWCDTQQTTSCAPCRDSVTKQPIPCAGKDQGQRIDDGRTYLEFLPPSSERYGQFGSSLAPSSASRTAAPARESVAPSATSGGAVGLNDTTNRTGAESAPAEVSPVSTGTAVAGMVAGGGADQRQLPPPTLVARIGDTTKGALFRSGKDALSADATAQLDRLVNMLRGKRNLKIEAVGHTDSMRVGLPETVKRFGTNQRLSEARAEMVVRYLQRSLGLDNSAVGIAGKAETQPIADNGTAAGRARNRRTEIAFWYDEEQPNPAYEEAMRTPPPPAPAPALTAPTGSPALVAPAVAAPSPAPIAPAPVITGGAIPSPEVPLKLTAPAPAPRQLCGESSQLDTNLLPFRVTVDGMPVEADNLMPEADRRRCTDTALAQGDVQLRFDPLQIKPALNVWTATDVAIPGSPVQFSGYTNYGAWITSAEVRIFESHVDTKAKPAVVLPLRWDGPATWTPPVDTNNEYTYLLRVYDKQGRFDETALKRLRVVDRSRPFTDGDTLDRERLTGWGQDSRALANIPVSGGTITVNGTGFKDAQSVQALGITAPVDAKGAFALRQILPSGPQSVEIEVVGADGSRSAYRRNLTLPANDWFYVAIGDLTVGQNNVSGPARLVAAETDESTTHYDEKVYVDGRGAFYLKGKIKGEYLLTASADTRELPVEDLFTNFASKDPRYLLRRIDPDRYYPVYGDDSTLVEDAPTEGKFYVRLERGDSHILWGNFKTQWSGNELTQFSRALYGGNLQVNSPSITKWGEKQWSVNGFAAEPGTLQSREDFRGTGGSLYYLRHLDLTSGSERLWVEVRDQDSGMVLERKELVPGQDYEINYLQGRVTLRTPLSSTSSSGTLISNGSVSGNPLFLVTTYEYVPGFDSLDGVSLGGNGNVWIGDHVRLGMTGYRQGETSQRQTLIGGDVLMRYTPNTWLKGEFAHSEGSGASQLNSITGGFDFSTATSLGQEAQAKRIEAQADLSDAGLQGTARLYWQERDKGFSGPGQLTDTEGVRNIGGRFTTPVGELVELDLKGDDKRSDSQQIRNVEGSAKVKVASEWTVALAARNDDRQTAASASSVLSENGERTDVQLRLHYLPLAEPQEGRKAAVRDNWDLYGFLQGTASRSGNRRDNDRIGAGGSWQATDRLRFTAEASIGDLGHAGSIGGDYRINDRSSLYLTYTSETERPDLNSRGRYNTAIGGTKYRVSDQMSVFGETRSTHGAGAESLTHAFGLDLAATDRWTLGLKTEWGTISDEVSGDLDRRAIGITTSYKRDKITYGGGVEYRNEQGSNALTGVTTDRDVWLVRNALSYQTAPDWRLLGKANFSFSSNNRGEVYDGDFVELVAGAAYRPVANDRLNGLVKYTYFQDTPTNGQVDSYGTTADFSQKSHVVSVDAIYDLFPWLSVGGKAGYRVSLLKPTKTDGEWFDSHAVLGVLRADLHFIRKWDLVAEVRTLAVSEADDQRSGCLLAAYYHINQYVKAGAGYNFTDFSDNMTDLSYKSHGWFFNVVGGL